MLSSKLALLLLSASALAKDRYDLIFSDQKVDFQHTYEWQGPELWTSHGIKLISGGKTAWHVEGEGTDRQMVMFASNWVRFDVEKDGKQLPTDSQVQLTLCWIAHEFKECLMHTFEQKKIKFQSWSGQYFKDLKIDASAGRLKDQIWAIMNKEGTGYVVADEEITIRDDGKKEIEFHGET